MANGIFLEKDHAIPFMLAIHLKRGAFLEHFLNGIGNCMPESIMHPYPQDIELPR